MTIKVTVLGAGGFIGSNLVEFMLGKGDYDITGIDVTADKLAGIEGDAFDFKMSDIMADEAVDACIESDLIVDLVAYANPSLYIEQPLDVFHLNFTTNMHVVDLAVKHSKRLIQYSTCEVYGKPTGETWHEDESDLVMGPIDKQRWIYASAKQLLERVIYAYGADNQLDYSIIRPFNFVGPRFDYLVAAGSTGGPRVFSHFMSALLTGGPMYLVDGGNQHRAFTHIDDASEAFHKIVTQPEKSNRQIYNVGNPDNNITIRSLAEMMIEIYSELNGERPDTELVEISGEAFYGEGYEDVDRIPPNIGKMTDLGWTPTHGMKETLRDAMESYLDAPIPV